MVRRLIVLIFLQKESLAYLIDLLKGVVFQSARSQGHLKFLIAFPFLAAQVYFSQWPFARLYFQSSVPRSRGLLQNRFYCAQILSSNLHPVKSNSILLSLYSNIKRLQHKDFLIQLIFNCYPESPNSRNFTKEI